jgi:transposase
MAQPRHIEISDQQRQELVACRDHHPKPYVREKAAAILKVAAGTSIRQVALCGLLRPRTPKKVSGWITRYLTEGLLGLLVRTGRGRKPAFSPCEPAAGGG